MKHSTSGTDGQVRNGQAEAADLERQREELARLIGGLLAKFWLRSQQKPSEADAADGNEDGPDDRRR